MSRRALHTRARDIADAIGRIREYVAPHTFDSFTREPMCIDAVIRNLTLIGEAAANLPAALTDAAPQIPWRQIVDMRNLMVHTYWRTDLQIVWSTIAEDIEALHLAVAEMWIAIDDS